MNIVSFTFLIFSTLTVLLYYLFPKNIKWLVLLISSLFFLFYQDFNIITVIEALVVLVTSYFAGIYIEKNAENGKSKLILFISIGIIIGQLFYLKYLDNIITFINNSNLPLYYNFKIPNSLIGISYYSLIMIGYIVDVYRGENKPQKNIFKLALFMTYFPILISGPFTKYKNMNDKLSNGNKFNYDNMCHGFVRMLWGLFKILVIAERINIYVSSVYVNLESFYGVYVWIAILLFPIQLYTNFSGSIDVIMGISKMIGIDLPENFNVPFSSKSITEFWRRWHITLGEWLKNYIFYPLQKSEFIQNINTRLKKKHGKNFAKKVSLYLSLFVMWFLIGAWHGGKMTFIIGSGILQFIFMLLEDLLQPFSDYIIKKLKINKDIFSYKLYCIIRTYLLFSISMVFFRAESIEHAINIFKGIFEYNPWVLFDNESLYVVGLNFLNFKILWIGVITLLIVEFLKTKGNVIEMLFKQNLVFRWSVIYLLIFFIIIFGCYGTGYNPVDFIYNGF